MPRNITKDDIYSAMEKNDLQKHLGLHRVNDCCPYCKNLQHAGKF